jgi:hypothetical protein
MNDLLDSIELEYILKKLPPKERDILYLWTIGGYSSDDIARIVKSRYKDEENLTGKLISAKIQAIIGKIRVRIGKTA